MKFHTKFLVAAVIFQGYLGIVHTLISKRCIDIYKFSKRSRQVVALYMGTKISRSWRPIEDSTLIDQVKALKVEQGIYG